MSEIRAFKDNLRERFIHRFRYELAENEVVVFFDDNVMIRMPDVDGLPKHFQLRLFNMVFDLLTARRSELWDDQVVFGDTVRPTREQMTALRDHFNVTIKEEE